MTRHDHLVNGREVAAVRNFLEQYDEQEKVNEILAVADGGTLTARALRTLLAEHDAYRSEARGPANVEADTPERAPRTPDKAVPAWAYDLLIAVLNYEDVHGSHDDGWMCFEPLLKAEVPQWEIEGARFIADYWAQKEKP